MTGSKYILPNLKFYCKIPSALR